MATRVRRIGAALRRGNADESGATAVQAIVMMPAIIFFFAAAVVLWQTVMIRQSLHYGTYEAMRYLSLYPPGQTSEFVWEDIARKYIDAELMGNPWVGQLTDANRRVTVTLFDANECGDKFRIQVGYKLFAPASRSGGTASVSSILPNLIQLELREDREGQVVCNQ